VVDSLRSGGFGSPSLGFGSRESSFARYRVGDDSGEDFAYLDKLAAQTAWQNGQLSDDAYLAALAAYVKALDKGSSSRLSAENQLADATWNIARNKLVRNVNAATTAARQKAALTRLLRHDRARLRTMSPGNEQYREQQSLIDGLRVQLRQVQWGEVVKRYNDGKLSDAQMRAASLRFAKMAAGKTDEQSYRDSARDMADRIADDELQDAIDAWGADPNPGGTRKVESLYAKRMKGLNPDSAKYEQYQESLQTFLEQAEARKRARELVIAEVQHNSGAMGDMGWLDFLRKRVGQEKEGSVERIRARDRFISETFSLTEKNLRNAVAEGTRDPVDLIDFYGSSLGSMDLDSDRAAQLRIEIADLRANGLEAISIAQPDSLKGGAALAGYGGHYVYPGGAPKGLGATGGYISQHDGSQFSRTNCGMAAAAMLAWDVSGGKVRVSGGEMRYYSGDREAGTWTDDMVRAMSAVGLGAREFHGMSFATFRKRIEQGKPAVLTGTNSMLPVGLQRGYTGDHSIYVADLQVKGGTVWYYVMDPNARGGYKGEWWPETAIHAFGWQGSYRGSAVFAGKSGNATVRKGRVMPPFQAFDTDYTGRSTLGRGGGANRAEAGQRKDWSKGKPTREKSTTQRNGADGEMVVDFLTYITRLESRIEPDAMRPAYESELLAIDPAFDGQARQRRAAELLERNGGDPRLAAIEWFTGETPSTDSTGWSQSERWFANAVGTKMGYAKVKKGDSLLPDQPDMPEITETAIDPLASAPEGADVQTGINPNLEGMARGLLARLGVAPDVDSIGAVAAWLSAENGGGEVEGYNPLKLKTPGETDLPGQFGTSEDGYANFESLDDGLDAAADIIRADYPDLIGALRSDPETFARTLGASSWSESPDYGNGVVKAYNDLPGNIPIIARAGPRPFDVPTDLAVATSRWPELADLLEVDPSDPVQMGWFEDNVASAKQAAMDGRPWRFIPPGGGPEDAITIPNSAPVAKDILRINYDYIDLSTPYSKDRISALIRADDDLMASSNDIDEDVAKRHLKNLARERDRAALAGDLTDVGNLTILMANQLNAVYRIGPGDTLDTEAGNNPHLSKDFRAFATSLVEAMEPRSTDPNDPESFAPGGDPFMAAIVRGALVPVWGMETTYDPVHGGRSTSRTGLATSWTMTEQMFVSKDRDGSVTYHDEVNDPAMFQWVTEKDVNTGLPYQVQLYRSKQGGLVHIVTDGEDSYQPIEPFTLGYITFFGYVPTGRSKEIQEIIDSAAAIQSAGQDDALGMLRQLAGTAESPIKLPTLDEADPDDFHLTEVGILYPGQGNHPSVQTFTERDEESGELVTWWTLDQETWIGSVGNRNGRRAPGLVGINGATLKYDPNEPDAPLILTIDGKPYEEGMGAISDFLGWYGTDGTKRQVGDSNGVGAPDGDYFIKRSTAQVSEDGQRLEGVVFDGSLTPTIRYRAGLIDGKELVRRVVDDPDFVNYPAAFSESGAPIIPPASYTERRGARPASVPAYAYVGSPELRNEMIERSTAARAGAAATLAAATQANIEAQRARREAQMKAQAEAHGEAEARARPVQAGLQAERDRVAKIVGAPKVQTPKTPPKPKRYDPLSSAPAPAPAPKPEPAPRLGSPKF